MPQILSSKLVAYVFLRYLPQLLNIENLNSCGRYSTISATTFELNFCGTYRKNKSATTFELNFCGRYRKKWYATTFELLLF